MPYFISNEQDDCDGWATIKISEDGDIETIGCHETMNEAVAQMIAISLDEGIEPGGEYDRAQQAREVTSFQKSKWPMFDRTFAARIKNDHPEIWSAGGNIKGNDQYEILTRIAEQGGAAETEGQIAALELREAWIARHYEDFRLPGVVAQMKWLAIGSRGEGYMKDLIREEIADDERQAPKPQMLESRRAELHNIREVRHFGLSNIEVREDAESNTIHFVGYASVFNHDYEVTDQFGTYTERIAPGAFTRTLSESPDVVMNLNHGAGGTGLPVARTKSGTLKLTQDDIGLRVSSTLDLSDPDVQAIQTKMRRGDLDEMSFAFRVNSQEWDDTFSDRTISEVNLARGDVSIVTFGANPATVAVIRSEETEEEDPRAEHFSEEAEIAVASEETVEEESEERVATITEYLSKLIDARQHS